MLYDIVKFWLSNQIKWTMDESYSLDLNLDQDFFLLPNNLICTLKCYTLGGLNVLKAYQRSKGEKRKLDKIWVLCTFTDIPIFLQGWSLLQLEGWGRECFFHLLPSFLYLFIYYFQQAAKYACLFMNSLFHSGYLCTQGDYTNIMHTHIHTFQNVLFYFYIRNEWMTGWLAGCLTWSDLVWIWMWIEKKVDERCEIEIK